jgi:pilus assembly protein Flp/PilA
VKKMRARAFLRRLVDDRRAATAVEYGLILALVFLAILASVRAVANQTTGMWSIVEEKVVTASEAATQP